MLFSSQLAKRIRLLRWTIPLTLAVLVAVYQFILSRWVIQEYGLQYHTIAEILFYGTGGPLLAFLSLDFFARWLEERETSELQAQILAETRSRMAASREISDEAFQTLYAISILLDSIEHSTPELSDEKVAMLRDAEGAVERTMQRLRLHLQSPSSNPDHPQNGSSRKPDTINEIC